MKTVGQNAIAPLRRVQFNNDITLIESCIIMLSPFWFYYAIRYHTMNVFIAQ